VDWLIECRIDTVAMEATGVYWIPVFQMLEAKGLEVKLVNAHYPSFITLGKFDEFTLFQPTKNQGFNPV
jgi:hypothetical protein